MKRRVSGFLLSLLLLLSLTACGGDIVMNQGSQSAVIYGIVDDSPSAFRPEASNDTIWAIIPDGSAPDGSRSAPDSNQAPSNEDPNGNEAEGNQPGGRSDEGNKTVDEDGWYTSKEEVALYIHLYGELPDNYVTKDEAEDAGWSGGNVERYTGEGTAIGGSRFGNREGLLPKEPGRTYTECDIDTVGENSRGAKRIVFSNDGLVYYTDDHYESFELLYGEP